MLETLISIIQTLAWIAVAAFIWSVGVTVIALLWGKMIDWGMK